MNAARQVLALAGGVGGGKLARGLAAVLLPDNLTLVVNTADDFVHLGLHISPDIDSVLYALADLNDSVQGWGLAGDTDHVMDALARLGGDTWFKLRDRDLATHLLRTQKISEGYSLSQVTQLIADRLGVGHRVAPMTDAPVSSVVDTERGYLAFQDYFVRQRCAPIFYGVRFEGAALAEPSAAFVAALECADAIVICPSNPFLSIDPILALVGVRAHLESSRAPVIAVSPIVGGNAVKGPLAKMMGERKIPPTSLSIARHYSSMVQGWLIDAADRDEAAAIESLGCAVRVTRTLMTTPEDKSQLAEAALDFAADLARQNS
ncbi:MAG: 2-phospho-L-lactate transferase [Pseudolabrys sp.]|nr:2-phospho-L-lactate transferase [Pseudolabrys sp.]MDP2296996.1 2-phospho-L-lactate transferase [Pseudolabrys sp.]